MNSELNSKLLLIIFIGRLIDIRSLSSDIPIGLIANDRYSNTIHVHLGEGQWVAMY